VSELPRFPFMLSDPTVPPPQYAELRSAAPVTQVTLPTGLTAWLVTRYADVETVLADPRFSRQALTARGAPPLFPMPPDKQSIFFMDPPAQSRLRRLVAPAFSPERSEQLRPRITQVAEELVDSMAAAGPPADLLVSVAKPLPILSLVALLGVDERGIETLREWIDAFFTFGARPLEEIMALRGRVDCLFANLIERRRAHPADDLLTDLIHAREGNDRLGDDELIGFVHDLIGAGTQPVTAEIVHAMLKLLREPARLGELRAHPELLPTAVDELLRHSQSAGGGLGSVRLAIEDVTLDGVAVGAGDGVIPSINAANFDEDVFGADAESLDLGRAVNPHLTFGAGVHRCVGMHFGRAELLETIGALTKRFPELRLAVPEAELIWNPGVAFRTPKRVSVTW
jgi:cytochrome P450